MPKDTYFISDTQYTPYPLENVSLCKYREYFHGYRKIINYNPKIIRENKLDIYPCNRNADIQNVLSSFDINFKLVYCIYPRLQPNQDISFKI